MLTNIPKELAAFTLKGEAARLHNQYDHNLYSQYYESLKSHTSYSYVSNYNTVTCLLT
jgi:hypothetical protein